MARSEQNPIKSSITLCFYFAALVAVLANGTSALAQYPTASDVSKDGTTVLLEDFASLPLSSPTRGGAGAAPIKYDGQLGRVNSMRSEPANASLAASRMFVTGQSSTLYVLDIGTKKFTSYLNFAEIFPKFVSDMVNTVGLTAITFDPGYAKNGKFYTLHVERPDIEGSAAPTSSKVAALDLKGYETTPAINPPIGAAHLESVLVEWTDSNIHNDTFEGKAREILRAGYDRNHPMGDMGFNPFARSGDADYGNMYIPVGDGAQGETPGPVHEQPQMLSSLMGKILRITPDLKLRSKDMLSENGHYRIPSTGADPNPFVSVKGARPEVYAYGFRHTHRITWDMASKAFIVGDIGLKGWEEINIVTKGGNYGYGEREGYEQLFVGGDNNGKTGGQLNPPIPFPEKDVLTVEGIEAPVTPIYPAAVYSHHEGDAMGNGFAYRGKLMPQLQGKYIFNDMTTGRLFYVDVAEMLKTGGIRNRQAKIHELQIAYKNPENSAAQPAKQRLYDIVAEAYARKGGKAVADHVLPGASLFTTGWKDAEKRQPKSDPEGVAYGGGRADVRMGMDGDGELYVLSKSDGMIRKLTGVAAAPPVSTK